MSIHTLDEAALNELADGIEALHPRPHHAKLLEIANRIRPGCTFHHALERGGWYRPGGVVTSDGTRIADNLESWARKELDACGDDLFELVERYTERNLLVTRHTGRTHYFVAAYGPAPTDFLQLEVEELQEVLDRELIDIDAPPEDWQELIEPIKSGTLDAQPIAASRYRFRRLVDIRQAMARAAQAEKRDVNLPRLLQEWTHSSAARRGHFSDHWIIALREHMDRYHNPMTSASLVSTHGRALKPFQWNFEQSGVELSAQLQAFDRAAGYISAWYFHLIAGAYTPRGVAYAVMRDLDAGFSYLPDTEVALIKGWVEAPYSV